MRDASRLERDAKAEHDFYHSLISQLQTELEDAKHSSELLRAELDRAREGRSRDVASSSATPPSGAAPCLPQGEAEQTYWVRGRPGARLRVPIAILDAPRPQSAKMSPECNSGNADAQAHICAQIAILGAPRPQTAI